jgi:hypothetical protein
MVTVAIAVPVMVPSSPSTSWRFEVTAGIDQRHKLGVSAWVGWDSAGIHSTQMPWYTMDDWMGGVERHRTLMEVGWKTEVDRG